MKDKVIDVLGEESLALFADGFDDAIIGIETVSERVVYSKNIMIDILIDEGMDEIDAIEHLEYNVWGAYVGEHTPIYVEEIL